MSSKPNAPVRVTPVQADNITAAIERTYRECGTYQWVRETLKNAIEAGATRVEFTLETQVLDSLGVYRRLIADNGCGMSADELHRFFGTFGGGGKPIGGEHENFGMGAKVSLLPWNKYGLVVISLKQGDLSMIRVVYDDADGVYGLLQEEVEDPATGECEIDDVYEPFDATNRPQDGCDWRNVVPDFVLEAGHGTVLVLMGNTADAWTVEGDPNRNEDLLKGIALYLNQRFWALPDNLEVFVDEFRGLQREYLPQKSDDWLGKNDKTRRIRRRVYGAKGFLSKTESSAATGEFASTGTVRLDAHTSVEWCLWHGDRPQVSPFGPEKGFIAVRYRDELYDMTRHPANFRSFGISDKAVRDKLFLIIQPAEFAETIRYGVYPRSDRNALLLAGGPNSDNSLPIDEWSAAFADALPDEIKSAIQSARSQRDDSGDTSWMSRLKERFGSRWKIPLRVVSENDIENTFVTTSVGEHRTKPKPVKSRHAPSGGNAADVGNLLAGTRPGPTSARRALISGGVPNFRPVRADVIEDGMLAAWAPHDGECGNVLLNIDHEVIACQIEHWQAQYAPHLAEEVADQVIKVYGQLAAAKIAHTEGLKAIYPREAVETFRSSQALTMALLGLVGEDQIISTRLGGTLGKRREQTNVLAAV